MNGLEIAYLRADLLSRELMLNTDISTQFIVAPLMDAQKREGEFFLYVHDMCLSPYYCLCMSMIGCVYMPAYMSFKNIIVNIDISFIWTIILLTMTILFSH
jgi:hypothetical protein